MAYGLLPDLPLVGSLLAALDAEEMRQLIEEIRKLPEAERTPFITWMVLETVMTVAYYVVVGLVIWALGRRIIQALLLAWRESRRAPGRD